MTSSQSDRALHSGLWILLTLSLVMSLHLAWVQKINWDEFFYLSRIYIFQRGALNEPLQNVHVHLFGWLTALEGGEIRQIQIARGVMWLCQAFTVWMIYLAARVFLSSTAALFAGLAYMATAYVLLHGTSFRTDPIAAALIMGALVILLRARLGPLAMLGFALMGALSALVTMKVVFFLPAFLGVGVWRMTQSDRPFQVFLHLLLLLALTIAVFAGLFLWHSSTFPAGDLARAQASASGAAGKVLGGDQPWFPRASYVMHTAALSPVTALMLGVGAILALVGLVTGRGGRMAMLSLLLLTAPLASFAIYRNAFPYYFPFIMPPAMILAGLAFLKITTRPVLAWLVVGALVFGMITIWSVRRSETFAEQKQILSAIHEIFPEPVTYIDRSETVSSFPKTGFFMSTWGIESYRARGRPLISEALEAETVPLLLLNSPLLEQAVGIEVDHVHAPLFGKDQTALKDSFIPHWGPIWVAGQQLQVGPESTDFILRVPGTYTLEIAAGEITLNGLIRRAGDDIALDRGVHRISATEAQEIVLRWADARPGPDTPPPETAFFTGF